MSVSAIWSRGILCATLALAFVIGESNPADAQLQLPRLSVYSKVIQHVGVTEISVEYSSPAKRGRKIFGGLVPYGKLWRTGANAATRISFSTDVVIGGDKVKAGTYALYTTPGEKSWTVVLNTNYKTGGTRGYKESNNVASFQATPVQGPDRERLTFLFANTTDNSTHLHLEWAGVAVPMPIKVHTKKNSLANINKALGRGWRPYFSAARYLHRAGHHYKALKHINTSMAIQTNWWNSWVKAQILSKVGTLNSAIQLAKQAQTLGANDRIFKNFFAKRAAKAISKWTAALAKKNAAKKDDAKGKK